MTKAESRLESLAESVASLKMQLHEERQERMRGLPQAQSQTDHTIFQPVSIDSVQPGGPFSEVHLFIVLFVLLS